MRSAPLDEGSRGVAGRPPQIPPVLAGTRILLGPAFLSPQVTCIRPAQAMQPKISMLTTPQELPMSLNNPSAPALCLHYWGAGYVALGPASLPSLWPRP